MNIFRGYTKYSLEDTQLISKILRQSQDKPYVATSSNLNDFSMYKIMRHFKELLPCQKNSVNVNRKVCAEQLIHPVILKGMWILQENSNIFF